MPPGSENPYPISDQSIKFPIPYFRPDSQNVYPISDPVRCGNFGNSQWIYGVRDFCDAPSDVRIFSFAINVHGNTRYSKNGIPDKTDGIYTLFQTKIAKSIPYFRLVMLENDTILYYIILYYMAYIGITHMLLFERKHFRPQFPRAQPRECCCTSKVPGRRKTNYF